MGLQNPILSRFWVREQNRIGAITTEMSLGTSECRGGGHEYHGNLFRWL
ncbi:hypothetical protein VCR15J2_390050 [Vibrio coralliirubri]|nr:hypothetical protein VCR15J2_390050 [Vibrio coralliirubri]